MNLAEESNINIYIKFWKFGLQRSAWVRFPKFGPNSAGDVGPHSAEVERHPPTPNSGDHSGRTRTETSVLPGTRLFSNDTQVNEALR